MSSLVPIYIRKYFALSSKLILWSVFILIISTKYFDEKRYSKKTKKKNEKKIK